jgi:hypothetical protein
MKMLNKYQLKQLEQIGESDSSEEDRIREMVRVGFDQLKHYKPAFVTQVKKIMDYLVKQDVAEYGKIWRGQYNLKDKNLYSIKKSEDMAVKAWRDGKINVKLSPVVNEGILNEDFGDATMYINVWEIFDVSNAGKEAGYSGDALRTKLESAMLKCHKDIEKLVKKELEKDKTIARFVK